jgi:PncC family amidohydrolase
MLLPFDTINSVQTRKANDPASAVLNPDFSEIAECKWMDLDEYRSVAESEMNGVLAGIAIRGVGYANTIGSSSTSSAMAETKLQRKPNGSKGGMLYTPPLPPDEEEEVPARKLSTVAQECAALLLSRKETVAVAESSTGGKAAAALVEVEGASKFFGDGVVCYSKASKARVLGLTEAQQTSARSVTEAHALMLAEAVRQANGSDWGVGETGVAGPGPSPRGVAAGQGCVAVVGPKGVSSAKTVLPISSASRGANMERFATEALGLLADSVGGFKAT